MQKKSKKDCKDSYDLESNIFVREAKAYEGLICKDFICEAPDSKNSRIHVLVDIIGLKLPSLIYYIDGEISKNDIVNVTLNNKKYLGIVREILDSKDCKNYNFKVLKASKSEMCFTRIQLILLDFIAKYYMCSRGIVAKLFFLMDARSENLTSDIKGRRLEILKDSNITESEKTAGSKSKDSKILHSKTNWTGAECGVQKDKVLGSIYSRPAITSMLDSKDSHLESCDSNVDLSLHHLISPTPFSLNHLSASQQKIFESCKILDLALIFGATGSGKSEIYFHLINETLKKGKQALLLMPEISLTPQMKKRLDTAFPNSEKCHINDVWHSKKTQAQKRRILQNLQSGEIQIIAGARSALFLPFTNLGLIIIDEEHDSSYKSSSTPKYNARDLAMMLSTKGVKVILGSATPSVKSYYLADKNNYLLRLDAKFYNSSQQIIIDNAISLESSKMILSEIINALKSNKQVIIFVPRRANFKTLLCRKCLERFECPRCSISLSVHNKTRSLLCHYCNFTAPLPSVCDKCGGVELSGKHFGTEEIKKELEDLLFSYDLAPNIAIFDRDYVNTENRLKQILNDFNSHKIDILIGTQMIAKGHDYHNVALSVILGIDFMLNIPDYTAFEGTFSLIYQVAGRSARKESGKCIIQSTQGEYVNAFVSEGDYMKVLKSEIAMREGLYPPFSRLALITFSHKNENKCLSLAHSFTQILKDILYSKRGELCRLDSNLTDEVKVSSPSRQMQDLESKDIDSKKITEYRQSIESSKFKTIELVGISQAKIPKINDKFYYQILLRATQNLVLQKLLNIAIQHATAELLTYIDIDIDPLNF